MEPRRESAPGAPALADTAAEFLSRIGACPSRPLSRHTVPGECAQGPAGAARIARDGAG